MFGSQLATPKMMQAVCSDADFLARHAVQICFQGSTTPPKSCSQCRQVWRLVTTAAEREDSALSGHCGACRAALLTAAREFRVTSKEPTFGYGNVPLACWAGSARKPFPLPYGSGIARGLRVAI